MSGPNIATFELGRFFNRSRVFLATLGATALFGGALQSQRPVEASTPSVGQAATATAQSFATQAIRDLRTAKGSEKQVAFGLRGVEAFTLQYPAKDRIRKAPAEYVIDAAIVRDGHGNMDPRHLNSIIISEKVGSQDVYEFDLASANRSYTQWGVVLSVSKSSTNLSPVEYNFTSGPADPSYGEFPLTTSEFGPLEQQAQTILNDAKNRAPITQPALPPFSPPVYHP